MSSGILSIGQSALNAAQVGVATTGHNIANATTPGYSRQVVLQGAAPGQNAGFGYVGSGTQVASVTRVYNEFLGNQVLSAQTASSRLTTYSGQIAQIDNALADVNAGVSPALQDFFTGVQNASADPNSAAARQALLSSGEALASRFQGLSDRIGETLQNVNGKIGAAVTDINVAASQIANLNDAIEKAQAGGNLKANDLLDQRDQAVLDLSKQIKVSVVKQGESFNVFVGNGQPLVVGSKQTALVVTNSPGDPSHVSIASKTATGIVTQLDENSLPGGVLGGLFEFRKQTLDVAQNTLGRLATNLAATFNAQHALGQTQTGAPGGAFFNAGAPAVSPDARNTGTGTVTASIGNPAALTTSDYQLEYLAGSTPSYKLTRLSDGNVSTFNPAAAPPSTVSLDGVDIAIAGTPAAGDRFLIRPVANGAAGFSVAIRDKADIALGAPAVSSATTANSGSGTVSPVVVKSTALLPAGLSLTYSGTTLSGIPANLGVVVTDLATPPATRTYAPGATVTYNPGEQISIGGVSTVFGTAGATTLAPPISVPGPRATLAYDATNKTITGFPVPLNIIVTANGTSTTYAPGTPVPYTPGATLQFGGVSVAISGSPADGDTFKVGLNTNGQGDNRNALLLGKLQTANTLDNGTTTFQGAYSQLVSSVGNKAHELKATGLAAASLLEQSVAAQQSESGVNLDEEAANLLRYQQAYQAAGKLMQTASTLFDVLLTLGR
ncbi:MAG: flagellar hook-associated protein FlgK [Herminiimonas sp.]|nr:flagellar hook-associated protein FlgK [Herminiimonas sp.]